MQGKKIISLCCVLLISSTVNIHADSIKKSSLSSSEYNKAANYLSNGNFKSFKKKYLLEDTTIYKDASFTTPKTKLLAGQEIIVLRKDGVCFVKNFNGYIKEEFLSNRLEFKKVEGEYIFDKTTNIYEKPDITSKIIGKFNTNEKITYNGKLGNWLKFKKGHDDAYIYDTTTSNEDKEENANKEEQNIITVTDKAMEDENSLVYSNSSENEDGYQTIISSSPINTPSIDRNVSPNPPVQILSDTQDSEQGLNKAIMKSKRLESVQVDYSTENQKNIIQMALQYEGNPYIWGGNSLTNGIDCSGFTRELYKKFGYNLPRTSAQQKYTGRKVSLSKLQAGDLIHFPGHVGMYIGKGKMIHASSPTTGIIITKITYGSKNITGATRIFN